MACKTWEWKQQCEYTSHGSKGGASRHAERVHDWLSVNAIDVSYHIHDHNLAQRYPLSNQMGVLRRQRHHESRQRHRQRYRRLREPAGPYEPQAQHGGSNALNGCIECKPQATQGVTQSSIVDDDDNHGNIRECRECYEFLNGDGAIEGDNTDYGAG